jgi:hypothetical protein
MSETIDVKGVVQLIRGILASVAKLSDEQLSALMIGKAKFKYFKPAEPKNKAARLDVEQMDKIIAFLKGCNNKEEGEKYITEQKLTIADLKELLSHIEIRSSSKKKGDIIAILLQSTIGVRLQFDSVQRT